MCNIVDSVCIGENARNNDPRKNFAQTHDSNLIWLYGFTIPVKKVNQFDN